MKPGDLVKRVEDEWTRYNPWFLFDNHDEVGIIIKRDPDTYRKIFIILWASGISLESEDDIEVVHESGRSCLL